MHAPPALTTTGGRQDAYGTNRARHAKPLCALDRPAHEHPGAPQCRGSETGILSHQLPKAFFQGAGPFDHAALVRRLASDSAGGATISDNWIKIWICGGWVPQVHWAAREVGKTDGRNYGAAAGSAWCSEFSSWGLRRAPWDPPAGNIDSQDMEDDFASVSRRVTRDQLLDGAHKLAPGDDLRFEWADGGQHSGIFVEYIDSADSPGEGTAIRTIEGNASSTVQLAVRTFTDVLSVGNCQ